MLPMYGGKIIKSQHLIFIFFQTYIPWPLDILPNTLREQYQRPCKHFSWSAPPRFHVTPTEPVAPNLLDRQFSVPTPDTVYVTDRTYLKVGRKWYYLTVFIDLFSRIIVGWDLSNSLERHPAIRAFKMAIQRRGPGQGLMIHSDRGVQYASVDFRAELQKHHFVQSMSRKGNCWDNAVAESFFHTIKTQMIRHCKFQNVREAEQAIFNYIEVYYNRRRKHSTNGHKSPAQYEKE